MQRLLRPQVQVVCDFCERHLAANKAAFADPRLELIINDAGAALEGYPDGSFDVIIGDLADPVEGGPCYQVRQPWEGMRLCAHDPALCAPHHTLRHFGIVKAQKGAAHDAQLSRCIHGRLDHSMCGAYVHATHGTMAATS